MTEFINTDTNIRESAREWTEEWAEDWVPLKQTLIFSTVTRHPGLFNNIFGIDYNPQTSFARVDRGMVSTFRRECTNLGIQFLEYPPEFKL